MIDLAVQIRAAKLPEPVKEWRFAPPRRWRFDLAWPSRSLALEIEGGHWINGRHNRASGFIKDMEKYNEAALSGWKVLRVTTDMVKDGSALNLIERALGIEVAG